MACLPLLYAAAGARGPRRRQPRSAFKQRSSVPRHHGQLLAWRLAGVQDEEQEAQEAPPVRDVVWEQLAPVVP